MSDATVPPDLNRARFVAANYGNHLRGLEDVAIGVQLVGVAGGLALSELGYPQAKWLDRLGVVVAAVALLGGLFLSQWLRSYYRRTFGEAYTRRPPSEYAVLVFGLAVYLVALIRYDLTASPVAWGAVWIGALWALLWVRWPHQARHHLLAAGATVGVGLLPLGLVFGAHPLNNAPALWATLGILQITTGLIDHRILTGVLSGEAAGDDD